jgi:hypothetical protein
MKFVPGMAAMALLALLAVGCATQKQSDTARTGVEQLLISTAVDRSLDKIDYTPVQNAKIYIEEKYLDCTDKNYVLVALHQRLMANGCTLVGKADDADVVLEVSSGGVGTDRNDLFVGINEVPLITTGVSIPRTTFYSRTRAIGTSKLAILAIDNKTKRPVINTESTLARTDYKTWTVIGAGGVEGGSLEKQIVMETGQRDTVVGDVGDTLTAGKQKFSR